MRLEVNHSFSTAARADSEEGGEERAGDGPGSVAGAERPYRVQTAGKMKLSGGMVIAVTHLWQSRVTN